MEEFHPISEVAVVTVGFVVTGAGLAGVGVAAEVPPEFPAPPPPPPPPPQLTSNAANPRIIELLAKLCFLISSFNCFKLEVIVIALLSLFLILI